MTPAPPAGLAALCACLGACTGSEPDHSEPAHVVRDSAGIEIVENRRPAWSDAEAWRLTDAPVLHIRGSDGTPDNILLDPASIDVDSRGRIIVGDGNQAGWDAVLVFDSTGAPLFRAGRAGPGPGEFGQLWWASSYRGDSIIGFDTTDDRIAVFGPEGEFAREVRTPSLRREPPPRGTYGYTAGMDAAFGDGHFLAYPFGTLDISAGPGPAWYRHLLLRVQPDGAAWDTLGLFGISLAFWSGTQQGSFWFSPIARTAVGRDYFYAGTGESFEVRRFDLEGRVTRIVRREFERRPVTGELKSVLRDWWIDLVGTSREANEETLARMASRFEDDRFADSLPPYSNVLLDPAENLWIEEYRWIPGEPAPVPIRTQWFVFDSTGVWLGNVEVPAGFIMMKVTDDRALGFVVGAYDVKEIEGYGLIKPAHGGGSP